MKVKFPHANGFELDATDFLRAWVDFYSKKKSKFKFDDPIPCLASAATLNDLKEKKHDFGVDFFCRKQVPKQFADTMQATNQFFELNKKLFQSCEAINPISGRKVKAVKLSAFAKKQDVSKSDQNKKLANSSKKVTLKSVMAKNREELDDILQSLEDKYYENGYLTKFIGNVFFNLLIQITEPKESNLDQPICEIVLNVTSFDDTEPPLDMSWYDFEEMSDFILEDRLQDMLNAFFASHGIENVEYQTTGFLDGKPQSQLPATFQK